MLASLGMYDPVTIDVALAFRKARAGNATLVCAYDDDEQCRSMLLEGALTFGDFLNQRSALPWNREIIFYCSSPREETSIRRAEHFAGEFLSTRALQGGVQAWREAGYPMASAAEDLRAMP